MPTTRRSTGGTRARPGPGQGQSTISFANKVSKPNARDDAKKAIITSGKAEKVATKELPEPETVPAKVDVVIEPEEEVQDEEKADAETVEEPEAKPVESEAEIRAKKVSETQIRRYWQNIEALRIAPRVHIEDVSVGEKVLRYFDVSSQYGPSVGIQRLKRWQRAERLGLEPPIEVLAVLLKEESKGNSKIEQAHMDQILNSTAVGAA